MTRLASSLLPLVFIACGTSGTLSKKPLTINTDWTVLKPSSPVHGGRERFVLVESPEEGAAHCQEGRGVVWRYKRGVYIDVEVLEPKGSWSKLRCSGYLLGSGDSERRTLMFTLADHPGSYRAVRIRSSEPAVVPSIWWSRRFDI
jgi:hypothetical protein